MIAKCKDRDRGGINEPQWPCGSAAFRRRNGHRSRQLSQRGGPLHQALQVLATLPAKRDEGHETGLQQRVAPTMSVPFCTMQSPWRKLDLLSVVQFQRHLATNHDPIIDGIRCVHTWRAAFEMMTHARDLLRHFLQRTRQGGKENSVGDCRADLDP